jgi:hypothetical protein
LWWISQVYDEDRLQQDKRLGVAKLAVNDLDPEVTREISLKLLHSVDPLKNRDTKDRGTLCVKVSVGFHILFYNFDLTEAYFIQARGPRGFVNMKPSLLHKYLLQCLPVDIANRA